MSHVLERRRRSSVVAAVACLALLAGCASASNDDAGGGAPEVAAAGLVPAAEGSVEYPVTLTAWAGETVLAERPERIAAIGFSTNLDALEVLGVTPVYTMAEESQWPWRDADWLASIELQDTATRRDPINFEAIASTEPDLIVAVGFVWEQSDYDRLSDIAPVLEHAEQLDGDKVEWEQTQRMIGEALDLSAASEEAITSAHDAISETAERHPEFAGRTMTVATDYTETGIDYYTVAGGTAEGVVTQLGFTPNPLAENFTEEPRVSDEQLGLLDADVLTVFYLDDAAQQAREQLPLFQALPPVAEGRYVAVSADDPGSEATWVLRRGASASSLPWAVDVLADWVSDLDAP